MITDEAHPLMQKAKQLLYDRLQCFIGTPFNKQTLERQQEIVNQHRAWVARELQVEFPVLVPLVISRLGVIDWCRNDLTPRFIRVKIINFVRQYPTARMDEVVLAFRRAFPNLHPDDVRLEYDKFGKIIE